MKNFVIAIDGFSSCGKSTVAKALAKELNFVFIDSGAMYRAVTLYIQQHKVNIENEQEVLDALDNIHIDFVPNPEKVQILLNGVDVSDAIRTMEVSEYVSEVSALKPVRKAMVHQQQNLGKKKKYSDGWERYRNYSLSKC
jgi:cytidylate kinase